MFDAQTTALLRSVLDEVCDGVSRYEAGGRESGPVHQAALLALANWYERQLSPTVPPPAVREIKMEPGLPVWTSLGER